MTTYQDRINDRLNYLYDQKKAWKRVLKGIRTLENKEIEEAITRTCALEMDSVNNEIKRLEGMQGDVRNMTRQPQFARHGEDSLVFDQQGRLNVGGREIEWGEESDFPPVEPRHSP